ncbi:MAG: acetoin dehydrogenase [Elusimicrobia bacterium GWC2_51_8]|nr:MAG: acetoin dehydrogenase [Elusimicrobia bacterium GWA2_51_34]OGR62226.1 MAG: acetoin dehydrogenase [Elusimicrobia bacterium GWC2_51_8]OGR88361.1 MAG: acetoin dehydrogenase [Elusimicrobia bacterium GWF2_52_66]
MKTKAAVLYDLNKPLAIEELSVPELKEGQVLVKVAFSGICHSQLNEVKGKKGPDKFLPHTLGHEGSGIVQATGPGVTKVKAGDHVVLTWIKGDGMDAPASEYKRTDGKKVNSGAISTFMEYAVISENRVVRVSEKITFKEAALLGCAIPTGMGIVMNTAKLRKDSSVAIFGLGGIGLSALLAAELMQAAVIIAIDIKDEKLEQARSLGATHTINAERQDSLADIFEITKGTGVDYAIEAAGLPRTMETAFKAARNNGGLCVLAGNLAHGERISIDPFDLIKGKRIVGTWGGETQPDRDIPKYVDLYLAGRLKLGRLITHTYALDNVNEALQKLEEGNVGRALISMDSGNS